MKNLVLASILAFLAASAFSADDDLRCFCAPTLSYDIASQWGNILPGDPPFIPTVSKVVRNQPLLIFVGFSNFKLDKDGSANVVYDFELVRPDGSKDAPQKDIPAVQGKIGGDTRNVFLPKAQLMMGFEDSDPLGKYGLLVKVRDLNSGREASAKADIELAAMPEKFEPADFMSKDSQEFLMTYYLNPDPMRLPGLLSGFFKAEPELRKKQNYNPMNILAFFFHTLKRNDYLLPVIVKENPAADDMQKSFLAMLLAYSDRADKGKLIESLGSKTFEDYKKNKDKPNPFVVGKIEHPVQEDILWSRFFATGEFEPVMMLAEEAAHLTDKDNLTPKDVQGKASLTDDEKARLMKGIRAYAAFWSLEQNARKHKLAAFYLKSIAARMAQDKPEAARAAASVLKKIEAAKTAPKEGEGAKKEEAAPAKP